VKDRQMIIIALVGYTFLLVGAVLTLTCNFLPGICLLFYGYVILKIYEAASKVEPPKMPEQRWS
jgi:hypothetical protein